MDVTSFTINHDTMLRGIYVSREDTLGNECVTTFDIRMKLPNREPVMDNPVIHTLEHLMAIYIRSKESGWADRIIYVGPMGCRTGMYLVAKDELKPLDILELMQNTFKFIMDFEGKVPASVSIECGNYLDHNLDMAKWEASKYYNEVLLCMKQENMVYPE